MAEAILRQATRDDIAQMSRIRHAVRENMLFEGMVITPEDVRQAIEETGRGWVIETDGAIAAFAIGNAINGSIWALFVDPDSEGRGYGQRLHAAMIDWLWSQNLKSLWLTTDPNTRAQRFYERQGWHYVGPAEDGEIRYELTCTRNQ